MRSVAANVRTPLDAGWEVAAAPAGSTPADLIACQWLPARVPGTAADALRTAGLWSLDNERDFDAEDWWWRVRFHAEPGAALLGFDGIATHSEVWLDGKRVLDSDNMFIAHALPVELSGEHELLIHCRALGQALEQKRPRPRWRVPMLEKQQLRWIRTTLLGRTPGWSPPCAAVGPWRKVWIERTALPVGDIVLDSRIDAGGAGVCGIVADLGAAVASARMVVVRDGRRIVADLVRDGGCWRGTAIVDSPDLWWPHTHGEPACYLVTLEVVAQEGVVIAIDLGSTGFRTLRIDRSGGGFALLVNEVEVFCRGACWTPLDPVSLSATPGDYRAAVAQVRDAGMNMLRVGGTMVYEDDSFYDALRRAGNPAAGRTSCSPTWTTPTTPASSPAPRSRSRRTSHACSARPCLAVVCGNSEGAQQAAMCGATRDRWDMPLFDTHFAGLADAIGAPYIASSAHGGAFPHATNAGTCSYYGVGAYLRPLEDARRAEVALRLRMPGLRQCPRSMAAFPAARRCAYTTRSGSAARRATWAPAGTSTTCATTT